MIETEKIKLPTGWKWVKLGEVCKIIAGQSPPGSTYRKKPEGLPFFQGKADFAQLHPVARTWCIAPKKIALSGDILLSVRAPVGPTNVANIECCIGRGLAAIRCTELSDRDFILYFFRLYEDKITRMGTGSTFQSINRNDIENLQIPLPPLPEQKRIAKILTKQMAAAAKAKKACEEKLAAAEKLPTSYLNEIFSSKQAKQWPRKKLGEVCLQDKRIIDPDSADAKKLPYLGLENIESNTGRILKENISIDNNKGISTTYGFDERHILYGKLRPYLNKVALPNNKGRCSTELIPFLPPYNADRMFLAYLLRRQEIVDVAMCNKTGSRMPRANIKELMKFPIPLPPLSEQKQIAEILTKQMTATQKVKQSIKEELELINKLPASLLQKAFESN